MKAWITALELHLTVTQSLSASPHFVDAARSALGVLVRFARQLPPHLVEDLVFRMGQCSMTESARNLAGAVAASASATTSAGALRDPGVAALLAALVGGMQGKAVAGTLQAAGLAPLASVYAAVWGTVDERSAIAEWQRELAGAAALDGAAGVVITPPSA